MAGFGVVVGFGVMAGALRLPTLQKTFRPVGPVSEAHPPEIRNHSPVGRVSEAHPPPAPHKKARHADTRQAHFH
ncbi:UNVERIFIED_CONTAM: hypothetical protein E7W76_11245 [Cronobacter sakazakii]